MNSVRCCYAALACAPTIAVHQYHAIVWPWVMVVWSGWVYIAPHDHLRRDSRMSAASTAKGHRLFRPEALEAQRQALLGRILINTPLAYWLMTCVDLRCRRSGGDAASPAGVRLVHAAHPCARRAGRIDTFGWRCAQSAAARSGERHRGDMARPAGIAALHGVSLRQSTCARAGRASTIAA